MKSVEEPIGTTPTVKAMECVDVNEGQLQNV